MRHFIVILLFVSWNAFSSDIDSFVISLHKEDIKEQRKIYKKLNKGKTILEEIKLIGRLIAYYREREKVYCGEKKIIDFSYCNPLLDKISYEQNAQLELYQNLRLERIENTLNEIINGKYKKQILGLTRK